MLDFRLVIDGQTHVRPTALGNRHLCCVFLFLMFAQVHKWNVCLQFCESVSEVRTAFLNRMLADNMSADSERICDITAIKPAVPEHPHAIMHECVSLCACESPRCRRECTVSSPQIAQWSAISSNYMCNEFTIEMQRKYSESVATLHNYFYDVNAYVIHNTVHCSR